VVRKDLLQRENATASCLMKYHSRRRKSKALRYPIPDLRFAVSDLRFAISQRGKQCPWRQSKERWKKHTATKGNSRVIGISGNRPSVGRRVGGSWILDPESWELIALRSQPRTYNCSCSLVDFFVDGEVHRINQANGECVRIWDVCKVNIT